MMSLIRLSDIRYSLTSFKPWSMLVDSTENDGDVSLCRDCGVGSLIIRILCWYGSSQSVGC